MTIRLNAFTRFPVALEKQSLGGVFWRHVAGLPPLLAAAVDNMATCLPHAWDRTTWLPLPYSLPYQLES